MSSKAAKRRAEYEKGEEKRQQEKDCLKVIRDVKDIESFLSKHHKELKYGKGKCSVPMWSGGCLSGFCDNDAFGKRPNCTMRRDANTGELRRDDGKYNGYVPGLACPIHGGPECPGVEIELGIFSGCSGTGGDCPVCGK